MYDSTSSFLWAAPQYLPMEAIVESVRRIGRQQGQNAYYCTCYTLLNTCQDLVLETSSKLLDLYYSNDFEEPESVSVIADDLRNDIHPLIARERRARSHWGEFFESNN
ncbi:unnamed protein product [Aspergillus niger]|nr:unnamed protein product [Aspergillus niger]